ncbi:NADH-quinone oxidoreductase subunit J [Candidatus Bathyarchaeota archaeon]|nr:MAG: NADH-quinone oxidoreductase subunit J [Candidatus Bathyarchaeota archaeon]
MDNPSHTRNHQHRHNLHSGRRTPNALNPKMTDLLFLAFAAVAIGAAILAIEARDLVYGAAALGIAFLGVAGLFFLLDAAYVGWFQIAVYIGAVVVLILFTVMLVGPKMGETPLGLKRVSLLAAILVSLLLGMTGALANATAFPGQDSCGSGCDLALFSTSLLKNYGVQLEFMSLVMAAAVIGALALSKTDRGQ